jgi:hypothetical protein
MRFGEAGKVLTLLHILVGANMSIVPWGLELISTRVHENVVDAL